MSIVEDAKQAVQGLVQGAMAKAVALAPDSWMPGGEPDPLIRHQHGHIGKPLSRIDGPLKVAGRAPVRGRISDGRHGLRRARPLHHRQGQDRAARYGQRRSRDGRRRRDDA